MSRAGVDQLLYLMDTAFEGEREHSLLSNLRSVTEDDWTSAPAEAHRSIFDIVRHVGECKYVYENHAFGDCSMRWDRPGTVPTVESDVAKAGAIDRLREGQRLLRERVAALDDEELLTPRRTNWGERYETRRIIAIMIQHDLYHAGEINHLRALRQGNDRWAWEQA